MGYNMSVFTGPGFKTLKKAQASYDGLKKYGLYALIEHPRTGRWYVICLQNEYASWLLDKPIVPGKE